ncbi:unnamed protein product [Sphenostylis stenocarpa]|uniref:DUF6737 domain-containing protein n=1 Tax=Sphenostylis stenocarpa TaxID=92480 RepID=A0AA86RZT0_9FABA|nr:unnamed protein product [Sphenostylis stenocarpa]
MSLLMSRVAGAESSNCCEYQSLLKTMIALVSVLHFPLSNGLPTQTHNLNSHHRFPSSFTFPSSIPNKTMVFGVNPSDSKDPSFFDENGIVNDMEGYLNHLSLEYDSVWDTKPSWCQPWTIALTGVAVIGISWLILHSLVVTSLVSSLIFAWWYIFLYSYPKAYSDMIAERRERVTNGVEDTFGQRKNQ